MSVITFNIDVEIMNKKDEWNEINILCVVDIDYQPANTYDPENSWPEESSIGITSMTDIKTGKEIIDSLTHSDLQNISDKAWEIFFQERDS